MTNLKAKDFQRRDLNNIVAILQRSIKRTIILFYIAKSKGIENVAKKANLNRESFYKMFKENSKPRFESIFKVVNALDIKLVYA